MNTFQVEHIESGDNEVTLKLIPHSQAGVPPNVIVIELDLPAVEHTIVAEDSLLCAALDQYVIDYVEVVESTTPSVQVVECPYSHQELLKLHELYMALHDKYGANPATLDITIYNYSGLLEVVTNAYKTPQQRADAALMLTYKTWVYHIDEAVELDRRG